MFRLPCLRLLSASLLGCTLGCVGIAEYDVVLRGGQIHDGSGATPFVADVALRSDRIVAIAPVITGKGEEEIDATGQVVAPGFINMLSWATESLLVDGRAESDVRQGVTLEVMGEGWSMGPWTDAMAAEVQGSQGDLTYPVAWRSLDEYLRHLEGRVAPNVASLVGATTVRIHELGYADRAPDPDELERMCQLVRTAMEEGAMGIGAALIYAPAFYAELDELVALCQVVAEYDGLFMTHMRSEGDRLLEAVEETLEIAESTGVRTEIYHLKAAGASNWHKLDQVVARLERARAAGIEIGADMYTYVAGATGLDAAMPPWVQEGGYTQWAARLQAPATRARVIEEMKGPGEGWENLYHLAGSADALLLVGFKNEALKPLTGKSLAEVAALRGTSPEETAIDLVIEDGSRVGTVYFLMSEENVRKKLGVPWITFCSDEDAPATEGIFLQANPHPRAYGNFARLLGKYVREEEVLPLAQAIHRLTGLPARNLRLRDRGLLREGTFADVVVFDPARIADRATFAAPHQYATGMRHVFVNGVQVLRNGEHTGALPGRVVRGPGYRERLSRK